MAEETVQIAQVEGQENPPTVTTTTETTETPSKQYSELEERAIAQGWKPKDQWEGPPEEHRSAKDFLEFGEILGKLKTTSNEVKELKNSLRYLSEHQKKVYQDTGVLGLQMGL